MNNHDIDPELLKDALEKHGECLNERQKKVLILRFGLEDGKTRTLQETGDLFGITRERIRQIEAAALRKLSRYRRGVKGERKEEET
mgnify:CR=1 FL=1